MLFRSSVRASALPHCSLKVDPAESGRYAAVVDLIQQRVPEHDAILGSEQPAAKPANGTAAPANGAAAVTPQGGTLAERIRALQAHASRARQQEA